MPQFATGRIDDVTARSWTKEMARCERCVTVEISTSRVTLMQR
jgi:hypothetical protein